MNTKLSIVQADLETIFDTSDDQVAAQLGATEAVPVSAAQLSFVGGGSVAHVDF